jgi:hypothetical protein
MTAAGRRGAGVRSTRKRHVIMEMQRAIGRELAARTDVPKTVPQRIADLLRELHRRLRRLDQSE